MYTENRISAESKLISQEDGTVVVERLFMRTLSKEQAIAEISSSINEIRNSRANLVAQIENSDLIEADLQQKLASLIGV